MRNLSPGFAEWCLRISIDALMDTVIEYFQNIEEQQEEFAVSVTQRLPKYMQPVLEYG